MSKYIAIGYISDRGSMLLKLMAEVEPAIIPEMLEGDLDEWDTFGMDLLFEGGVLVPNAGDIMKEMLFLGECEVIAANVTGMTDEQIDGVLSDLINIMEQSWKEDMDQGYIDKMKQQLPTMEWNTNESI